MKYLLAFLTSLVLLAALPVYADDEGCVTTEKFVSQNEGTATVEWIYTLQPQQVKPVLEVLGMPTDEDITEIKLFEGHEKGKKAEPAIAFGHDGLVCLWAKLPPPAVMLIVHVLEVTKREAL